MKRSNMSLLVIVLAIFYSLCSFSQDLQFVKLDENFQKFQKFSKFDSVIIVLPDISIDNQSDKDLIEIFNIWGDKATLKNESELTAKDYEKHILVLGPFNKFKSKELLSIPIKQSEDGFSFKNRLFNQPNDAFVYINDDATRLYKAGNSYNSLDPLRRNVLGAYHLYIVRDNEFILNGFCSSETGVDSINNLEELRKKYFISKSFKYFDLNFPRSTKNDSIFKQADEVMSDFIDKLAVELDENTQNLTIMKVYIYAKREDLQGFLAIPMSMHMWGLNVNNVIHSESYDIETIKHEATHNFIKQKIGDNHNNFFNEGFRQYTEYLFDKNKYRLDKDTTLVYLDLLTVSLTEGNWQEFFGHPQPYPISGVFVKYVIDKSGLKNFKEMYSKNMIAEEIKKLYGLTMMQLITEFKDYIKQ